MEKIFEDVMDPGIELIPSQGFMIPDYLSISSVLTISIADHLDPTKLNPETLYKYEDNIYLTDAAGNIAFIDCHLKHTTPTLPLRASHLEYRNAKGKRDAGHLGLSLGQHPSIAMEQDSYMNRWGIWRRFEMDWSKELKSGRSVHIIGVFVEGEGTYSPFWCIREEIDEEVNEYIFTNDDMQ